MPEDTVFGFYRIKGPPANEIHCIRTGDHSSPMQFLIGTGNHLPTNVSPDNQFTLFTLYYTPEIVDLIVEKYK